MTVPVERDAAPAWRALSADGKRARVLEVAGRLFAEHGIELPMPELAAAVGVGVGSLYRQFGTKEDVVTALVVQRAAQIEQRARAAAAAPDAFAGLAEFMHGVVADQLSDRVAQEAWGLASERPEVVAARARLAERIEALVARAHAQGALRAGITAADVGFVLAGARRAERIGPGGAARVVELALGGMAAR